MHTTIEKVNIIYGAIITFLVAVFGKYYILFVGFLLLNVVDYITGCIKAKYYLKNTSSEVGAKGIFKKVSYWVVIAIAFFVSNSFGMLGNKIGKDLSFLVLFGWFTLASYIVNEIRSILENLIEMNVDVPQFLIKGLEVANKIIDKEEEE